MPGMGTALKTNNSTIVSAFQAALLHQGLVVLVILAALALAWNALRAVQLRRSLTASAGDAIAGAIPSSPARSGPPEAAARRLLRVAFGLVWIFDGLLQGQTAMPLGMTSQVVTPAASSSQSWVQHLVNAGTVIWNDHPITAATAAVWIQVGIGIWLLVAPRGAFSRLGGVASAGWAVVVWIFGEAFGGIFAPGLSWMFGAPGAVAFYAAAGVLIALPERMWATPRLGRRLLGVMGAFFFGMAVLQAWPGRGFWQSHGHDGALHGTLATMVTGMAATPQPAVLSSIVSSFASFDAANGWAVNLFVVIVLAAVGIALLSGRVPVIRIGLAAAIVLCLADWVLVEDFGFFGGVGTDPNSMVPIVLLVVGGYIALARVPVAEDVPVAVMPGAVGSRSWRARISANPTYAFRALAAIGAIGITVLGVAPMAVASVNPNADAIVSQAIDGTPDIVDGSATPFQLVDQYGHKVSLASLHGKTVALTFLDPVCTSDCPIIAQEFRESDAMLGARAKNVDFVAVVANPLYRSVVATRAFDRVEGLDGMKNWLYLTGSVSQLNRVWSAYGIQLSVEPGGAMVAHSDLAYVIDATGHTREVLDTDPGPGNSATRSSFAGVLTSALRRLLPAS